ncbi:MAG: right-handed parallel beta-helix repeat-containing protein, partial [Polyangia bacterium]|nr:right-handed parallel beta-helix repeat-containing protein [Polyangia bacterium]
CPELWVAEGVYPAAPSAHPDEAVVLTPGLRLYGGFSGTETKLLERNLGAHATVFDGELGDPTEPRDNACRIVVMAAETRLDGFTVRNGSGSQGCTTWAYGLGIYAESINATVANCLLTGNGGHFGEAGILVSGSGRVLIHDTVFELNSSRDGALGASGSALVEVTDCIFRTNDSSFGSAITLREQAELAAVRCSFQDNDSPGGNATVASFDSSTATLTNCIFSGNNASVGAVQSAGASTTLVNCLVAGNVGTMSGGIWASGYGPTVLQNCTVANNTGNSTGGLLAMSNLVVVRNSILWGNTSNAATVSESQLLYSTGTLPMVRHTTMEGAPVLAGEGNRNADPLFVNADPGLGPLDLRLGAGSPCIDAGSTALLLPDEADLDGDQNVTEPIPFDLDGGARLAGAAVDMGAYEAP